MKKKVDIIVSCYNEEDNVFPFYDEIIKYLNDDNYIYNIVYVNDGSLDTTYENLLGIKAYHRVTRHNKDVKVSYISFTHNFGHEAAMCAGLDTSSADYLVFMDADLQHPPKKILEIIKKLEEGADAVLLKRLKYKNASIMKKITSRGYYYFSRYVLQNKNIPDVSDYFVINRNLANLLKEKYRTRLRFLRSFVQMESKNKALIEYEAEDRFSGVSRYNYLRLIKLAIISELARSKFLRNKYKETENNKIYEIDEKRSSYE